MQENNGKENILFLGNIADYTDTKILFSIDLGVGDVVVPPPLECYYQF